jgi:hypothetical protein
MKPGQNETQIGAQNEHAPAGKSVAFNVRIVFAPSTEALLRASDDKTRAVNPVTIANGTT